MNVGYTLGIPNRPDSPSQDQPNMKINNDAINTIFGVDHISFNQNNGGYHTVVHETCFSTIASNGPYNYPRPANPGNNTNLPPSIGLTGQIVTAQCDDGNSPDEMLWFVTGGGKQIQLTSNINPFNKNSGSNGYTFWPNGIIVQWGQFSTSLQNTSNTQNFNINFKNGVYNVQLTPIISSNPGANRLVTLAWNSSSGDLTKFAWYAGMNPTPTGEYSGISWTAIGW